MTNLPPGVTTTAATTSPPRSTPTDTGVAHIPVLAARAPGTPVVLLSIGDFVAKLDARQTYSTAYDWCDAFFRDGGNRVVASPVTGPAAAKASVNVPGTSGTGLVVTATDAGEWANGSTGGLTAEVANGTGGAGTRTLIIRKNGVEIDRSTDYTTNQAAVDYFATSTEVDVVLGGGSGLTPVMAVTNLTGGTLDRASIGDSHWQAALDRITRGYGPGQVAAPDWTSTAAHTALLAHAAGRNRFAVCDPVDTTSKATLLTTAQAIDAGTDSSHGLLVAPWVNIPGLGGAAGAAGRAVPGSAIYCAAAARTDASDSPNQAPAGEYGVSRYATGVRASFSRDTVAGVNDAGDLNAAGVNLIIEDDAGDIVVYGNRTLVDPAGAERNWLQASNARYRMSIIARANEVGKPYVFRKVTRNTVDGFDNALNGLLLADYLNDDLFGDIDDDRPDTAFAVDTLSVNTAETIQNGELHAVLTVRPTRGAERVVIDITAVALTEPVA